MIIRNIGKLMLCQLSYTRTYSQSRTLAPTVRPVNARVLAFLSGERALARVRWRR
jgi:hypothetical protein